jgi:hypothetical protein
MWVPSRSALQAGGRRFDPGPLHSSKFALSLAARRAVGFRTTVFNSIFQPGAFPGTVFQPLVRFHIGGPLSASSAWSRRYLVASAVTAIAILLSSCSESNPGPLAESSEEQEQLGAAGAHPIVRLRVGDNGWLLKSGKVRVRVSAFCQQGYQVAESGPLSLTQRQGRREAYGEVFLQLQLGGCSGEWEEERAVLQQFEEPSFRPGRGRVSVTFAVVRSDDPEGTPHQVSIVKEVRIRRPGP